MISEEAKFETKLSHLLRFFRTSRNQVLLTILRVKEMPQALKNSNYYQKLWFQKVHWQPKMISKHMVTKIPLLQISSGSISIWKRAAAMMWVLRCLTSSSKAPLELPPLARSVSKEIIPNRSTQRWRNWDQRGPPTNQSSTIRAGTLCATVQGSASLSLTMIGTKLTSCAIEPRGTSIHLSLKGAGVLLVKPKRWSQWHRIGSQATNLLRLSGLVMWISRQPLTRLQ